MTWIKTTIKQLKEDDRIKYVTTAGEYIVYFKAVSQGKVPSLNSYTTKDGKKIHKRPKVSSIKEVYRWQKPEIIKAPEGFSTMLVRDVFSLPKGTILTIHKKNGVALSEVVLDTGTKNEDITVFVSTGEKKQYHTIPVSDINKLFKGPNTFNESVDYRYELVAPRDYDTLHTILQKGDLVAYRNKGGEMKKGAKVLEVIRNGDIRIKLYKYPHTFTVIPKSLQEFYIKKSGKPSIKTMSTDKTSSDTSTSTISSPTSLNDLNEKVEYLYNKLEKQQKEITALRTVHTAQINKLYKYIMKMRNDEP